MRWILTILSLTTLITKAQKIDTIEVSKNLTTYIIMDSDVIAIETGSNDYGAIARNNIVMMKTSKINPPPTSLMVQTKTSVSVWIVKYNENPKQILIRENNRTATTATNNTIPQTNNNQPNTNNLNNQTTTTTANSNNASKFLSIEEYNRKTLEKYGNIPTPPFIQERMQKGNRHVTFRDEIMEKKFFYIFQQPAIIKDIGEYRNGIFFSLSNIFVDREFMYFKINIKNTSSIAFDIDIVTFERMQGQSIKRKEALSNNLLNNEYYDAVYTIAPMSEENLIFVIKIFAFDEKDFLIVKMAEIGGVRGLRFNIPAKLINKANPL